MTKINKKSIFFEKQKMEAMPKLKNELDKIEEYIKLGNFQDAESHSDMALWYIKILDLK